MSDTARAFGDALRDRYVLERELGYGGMALVYLARDLKHERVVALKVLRPDLAAILGAERFFREIRLTAGLQHPHILPLLDSGEAAGQLFYVMPYVEGESLRHRLDREGQLPLDDALRITRGVAGALDYAHQHGVIHRDIKPENILLYQGEPMVADFGIALAVSSAGKERLTETGLSLGTPAYMSPEQASAEPRLDGRSDQYSLACVVYEMLAGETPYTGKSAQAIIAKRLVEAVPRLSTLRAVPAALEAAVSRALAKAPADRFATVGEFAKALENAKTAETAPTVVTASTRPRLVTRRMAALLGSVGALAVVTLLAFWLRPAHPSAAMESRQLTFTGKVTEPALSPDGQSVAYVSGGRSLVVQRFDGGDPLVLVPPARFIFSPRWTGDGNSIVFTMFRDSTELAATYMVGSRGGPARKVYEDIVAIAAGRDSTTLIRVPRETHRIEIVDLRTQAVLRAFPLPDSLAVGDITESPDQRFFAFPALGAIWTLPLKGGTPNRITSGSSVRWSSSSDALYFLNGPPRGEALFKIGLDRSSGRKHGEAVRLASLPGTGSFDVQHGRLVYTLANVSVQARALTFTPPPRHVIGDQVLTEGTAIVSGISISPDGQTVAYSQQRGENEEIFLVPFTGGTPSPIGSSPAREHLPSWSPTGSRLAFVREDSSGRRLMIADVASGTAQRVGSLPGPGIIGGDAGWALWAADGRHMAYLGQDLHRVALLDVDRQAESDIRIPDSLGTGYINVVPSPEGRSVLVSTLVRATDWGQLSLGEPEGNRWRRVQGPFGESYPIRWSRDGWIYLLNDRALFTDYGPHHLEVWRMKEDHVPENYVTLPDGCVLVDLSADGNRAACTSWRRESDLHVATGFDPSVP